MKILILGGNGFIGRHLARALVSAGQEVRIFSRTGRAKINLLDLPVSVEWINGDFTNEADLFPALKNINTVIHLAATTLPSSSNLNIEFDIESNLIGTVKFLHLGKKAGIKKVIFASSGGTVYGNPRSLPIAEDHPTNPTCSYGITKLAVEKYIHLFHEQEGLDYQILRIANPYGPGQNPKRGVGAIANFSWKIINNNPIYIWGDGSTKRDYLYIDDLVAAFMKAFQAGVNESGNIYNIGSGVSYSLNEIIGAIEAIAGKKAIVFYEAKRSFDVKENRLDISAARSHLLWDPKINIIEGIKKTIHYMRTDYRSD